MRPGVGYLRIDKKMTTETAEREKRKRPSLYFDHGSMGVAGRLIGRQIGRAEIVKYTDDFSEAQSALRVMNTPCPCTVRIFDVEQIQYSPDLWSIEMEEARELNKLDSEKIDDVSYAYRQHDPEHFDDDLFVGPDYYREAIDFFHCLLGSGLDPVDAVSHNVGRNSEGSLALFDLGMT